MKWLTLLVAVAALALAGCGGDDSESTADSASTPTATATADTGGASSGGENLKISADPGGALKFDKSDLTAKAGKVTITMDNPSDLPHAVEIEGNGVEEEGETVNKGGKSVATADLKAGKYEFYCPVPGHKAGGMKGTLTDQ
jgi:plastocyanin